MFLLPCTIPNRKKPALPQDAPYPWTKPTYGQKIQLAKQLRSSPKLNSNSTNSFQYINGTFIHCARAIDPTMLSDLNETSICQYAPTQDTLIKLKQVLDYALTHPLTTIQYHASDTILMTDTYEAYLVLPYSHIRIAGQYCLTNCMIDHSKGTHTPNGPILT